MRRFIYTLLTASLLACGTAHAKGTMSETNSDDHLKAAQAAIQARNWGLAQTELDTAVRADPRNADIHNLMGYTARKSPTPNLAKAFEHYKIALQLNPKHRGAHEYIGEAYLMNQQPAEAQKHLAALEQICGNRSCEEYEDLAKAISNYQASHP
ncbi:MAG: tetratricopeptide repeat protein [Burkholderiales bacterium]|jgi:Tfp pilus assembly protein PilF|nr:tetratricopeptide repeat protein [Burkholderiales bacterium]